MINNKGRVVIVGAGAAGLTAAAYLARENFPVLLLEKNERVGGLIGTFENQGFFFDSGPRAFVNSGILKPIMSDLGIQWEFYQNQISLGIEDQLFAIKSMEDIQEYQRVLVHLYPENKDDIEKIITSIHQLSNYTKVLYEFDNPSFVDFSKNRWILFKKLIPWTFKFLHALSKFNQYNMPMEVFLKGLTNNQSLIDILIQHFFKRTPTYFALGYFHVYMDYFYPRGGTGALPNLLKDNILEWGGEINLNKTIVEIDPSQSTVIDADGNRYPYDHLIWAADLKTMYRILNQDGLDPQITRAIEVKKQQVLSSKGAESVFIMFIAVNRPPSYFQENGGEHLFFTPSRQGLGEVNQAERMRLINDFDQVSKVELFNWLEQYIGLNTFEISIPALRDHTLAPEGQTGLMVSFLFDYQVIENVVKAGWYDEFKHAVQNGVIDILSRTLYKGLSNDLLFKFSSTPLTINKISGSSEGAITGWSFETDSPVINQLKDIPKSPITPIPNIFQAGQWAYSPAGVPIAMLTGWYATQSIKKQSGKK